MSGEQIGSAIALCCVIGFLLIGISAISRGYMSRKRGSLGDKLSKFGLFFGGFFMLPLVLLVMTMIIVGR